MCIRDRVRVADHKQAFSVSVPRLHQPELQGVDVLKLVHEKIGIEDEHDRLNLKEEQVAPDEYIFSGRLEVDYLNEKYDLNLPENEEYETLAGLILYYNEDIPEEGERISIEDISFEIVSVKSARIEEVRVKI